MVTFFPGFPSTSPTTFSPVPTILSTTFSVFVRGFLTVLTFVALGLATRPVVTLVVVVLRGLDVLALVVFLGAITDSMAWTTLGLELPGRIED
jgi:hypothetical protein